MRFYCGQILTASAMLSAMLRQAAGAAAIEDATIKKFHFLFPFLLRRFYCARRNGKGAVEEEWLFFLLLRSPGRNRGRAPHLERFYTVPIIHMWEGSESLLSIKNRKEIET